MKEHTTGRRNFIKQSATVAGMGWLAGITKNTIAAVPKQLAEPAAAPARIRFSVININHNHINSMTDAVKRGGGELVAVYAKEPELLAAYSKLFPEVKMAKSEKEILEDPSIQVILSSSIPDEREPLGIRVMQHGKDYLVDKPGIITLEQLAEARRVQQATKRIYSIMFSERFENKATVKAGELIKAGAIGKVIQTIGLGPHRMNPKTRPDWFFDKKRYGGIITDIGSHQFDQYLFFTGTTKADIVASQVGNTNFPQYPKFQDFGDVMLSGNGGMGYIRVDWFTPDGLDSWGDGRLTILGTDGYIEVRKNTDIASGHTGGNHLYLVDKKEARHIDCNNEALPFGKLFVDDVINRSETAMPQAHCFLTMELALKAQKNAKVIELKKD
ncbi:MAG: Gfo/Idh/MocA family oxidoreductase [Aquabacterium sp.]|nr:Gfo/Idh/MocA family oxidoreductase [Ferruginibacter sp.]